MQITKIRSTPEVTDEVVQDYLDAKAAADRANEHLTQAQEKLIAYMAEKHMKSTSVTTPDGIKRTVTYVKREAYDIDEKGLRRALRARVFDKYTKRVLDRKAMEAAMETGEVDPMTVARFLKPKDSKPYLKFTEKDTNDD